MNLPFVSESAGDVRHALRRWLQHQDASSSVIDDARLVATELVSNSIRHADPLRDQTLLVQWERDGDELVLSVYDGGGPSRPHPVDAPPDAESGRGLAIVEALSLRWTMERTREATVVHVHLPLH